MLYSEYTGVVASSKKAGHPVTPLVRLPKVLVEPTQPRSKNVHMFFKALKDKYALIHKNTEQERCGVIGFALTN